MAKSAAAASRGGADHPQWSSRLAFILAATGSAVGLGNIWKFPYITGENGGGAFVLVYLVSIAVIGIPIMIAEVMIGRRGRLSPINSMKTIAVNEGKSPNWLLIGGMGTLASFIILSFYSVVAGWTMPYVIHAVSGSFTGQDAKAIGGMFGSLLGSWPDLLLWHTIFIGLTVFVSAAGVKGGLERAVVFLMPALFVLLLIMVGYGMTTGYFGKALDFLFTPDFSKLTGKAVLIALGHAFFTLSLASGAMMAYGSYLPDKFSIAKTSIVVAIADTAVALLAGMAIYPIVFGNGLDAGQGPGLIFVTLPIAFGKMSGGLVLGTLFFILLLFAAWSSSIAMLESLVEWLQEKGIGRVRAAIGSGVAAWVLGLLTVLSFNVLQNFRPLGMFERFQKMMPFELLDFLASNIMLPLGGLLTSVFVGWVMKRNSTEEELRMGGQFFIWYILVRYVAPLCVAAVFVYNIVYG